jgi:hypothetical protein
MADAGYPWDDVLAGDHASPVDGRELWGCWVAVLKK